MSDFYLTLPSNTEPSTNTTAKFTVYLPYKIDLSGKWEVALVEIQYPFSWNNLTGRVSSGDITDNWIDITFSSGYRTIINVPPGYYENIQEILKAIEYGQQEAAIELRKRAVSYSIKAQKMDTVLGNVSKKEMKSTKKKAKMNAMKEHSKAVVNGFSVTYNETLKRIKVKKDPAQIKKIKFSTRLQYMLGLSPEEIKGYGVSGDYIPDLRGGFYSLYVYCSLVEPQIVGNDTTPLLRLVNIEGTYGCNCEKIFHSPHYVPIVTKEITKIDIEIKDDNAQLVPFDFGKTVLKLHIRKRRPLL
jgi:hypothetical protein